jgi:hypothetical protein
MITPNRHYTATGPATARSGDVPPADTSSTVANLPDHARVSVGELRQHWQRDVDQWHHEIAALRARMRVAVGITVAATLACGAAIWFAGIHRGDPPACPPAHATGRQLVTAAGAG